MEKILITGSHGFVGQHLAAGLRGRDIVEFNLSQGKDVTKKQDFDNLPSDIATVIHLAAIANVPLSWEKPEEVLKVNLLGTLNVLEFARKVKAKVIFAASYLYGIPQKLPITEEHPLSAENPYGLSKLSAEALCRIYSGRYDIPVISLRFFNIYGPGQAENMVISQMIGELKRDGKVTILDGRPKRDFVYISDVVSAYLKALEAGNTGFDAINIGSGESYSIAEIARKLIQAAGLDEASLIDKHEERPNDIPETLADISQAKRKLGWEPKMNIDEGLKLTLSAS
ncbi:MAG: GDP-mannose 4,6-dehydratase [Candidatus Daviesbacteria bacterium]|nr:MAG: GDP-mannose 4,6-dehydratase [Candidatus Daviesbacteria bacterium]